jgi:hypothetical protein
MRMVPVKITAGHLTPADQTHGAVVCLSPELLTQPGHPIRCRISKSNVGTRYKAPVLVFISSLSCCYQLCSIA